MARKNFFQRIIKKYKEDADLVERRMAIFSSKLMKAMLLTVYDMHEMEKLQIKISVGNYVVAASHILFTGGWGTVLCVESVTDVEYTVERFSHGTKPYCITPAQEHEVLGFIVDMVK